LKHVFAHLLAPLILFYIDASISDSLEKGEAKIGVGFEEVHPDIVVGEYLV
jgi:hypothetical protein